MRQYEMMVILDPELEERTVAPSLDQYLSVVTHRWWHRRERRHLGPPPPGLRHQRRSPRASTP